MMFGNSKLNIENQRTLQGIWQKTKGFIGSAADVPAANSSHPQRQANQRI